MRLLIAMAVALAVTACDACSASNAVGPCGASTNDDACILPHVAQELAAHKSWSDALDDVGQQCGASQTEIEQTWGFHISAEVSEGFVPLPFGQPEGGH